MKITPDNMRPKRIKSVAMFKKVATFPTFAMAVTRSIFIDFGPSRMSWLSSTD